MSVAITFRPRLGEALRNYSAARWRHDLSAGFNAMILAFPLSMAFAIAAGVKPEQGLFTAIIGGGLIAALGGSRVQIGGPTGAFIVITYSVLHRFGADGLVLCTMMAGAIVLIMGLARMGTIIRFIPYPVSRAFTKGIAVLILASQIIPFFGLAGPAPVDFAGKIALLFHQLPEIHFPTVALGICSVLLIALWPSHISRRLPGSIVAVVVSTAALAFAGGPDRWHIATLGSQFGEISRAWPTLHLPHFNFATVEALVQPSFAIALLVAMQALLCAVVTDGMIDDRHDSNQELVGQGIANLVGPLFGCIPATGAVARSLANVRAGATSPVAGIVHSVLLLLLLLVAAPWLGHIPIVALSAVLIVAAFRMVSWRQFARLSRWPLSDSSIFLATFVLTVLADLTIAVEVGVVLAALLMVKRVAETSKITTVDESTETEGSHHSLVGREIPPGVLVFRVFGAFFFGVVDKLDDELRRAKQEPDVLILRVRKVLAIDATGLQALEDLHAKLRAKGKHLIISGPHTQPYAAMIRSGLVDRIGEENFCPHIAASLERAREILGLPPQDAARPAETPSAPTASQGA